MQNLHFSEEKYKRAWEKYTESCRKKKEQEVNLGKIKGQDQESS